MKRTYLALIALFICVGLAYADFKPSIQGLDYYESGSGLSANSVQSSNINWANVNGLNPINSGGVNWSNINGTATINNGGVNWSNLNAGSSINNGAVNWSNINAAGELNSGGVNWANINGTATINAGGINWTNANLFASGPTGNFGVGTGNPGTALDVNGTVRATVFQAGAGVATISGDANGNIGIGTSTASRSIAFGATGASGIDSSGNMGIGTAVAAQKLVVAGTAEVQGFKMNLNPSAGYVLTSSSVGVGTWMPAASGSGVSGITVNKIPVAASSTSLTDSNMNQQGASNIGISTTGPQSLFAVGSTSQFQVNSSGAIAASTGITTSGGYTQSGTTANTFTGTPTFSNATYSALFSGGNVGIGSATPGTTLDVNGSFRTLAAGNVGIGTVNPGQKVDITGAIRFSTSLIGISTLSVGAVVQTSTNQACNTTCTGGACLFGLDLVSGLLDCTSETADSCVCLAGTGG